MPIIQPHVSAQNSHEHLAPQFQRRSRQPVWIFSMTSCPAQRHLFGAETYQQ